MESYITSTEAAELLGITRRTLLRWEEQKILRSQRDEGGHRYYRKEHVLVARRVSDMWKAIRRRHRDHLRKLPAIQKEVQRFIVTTPLERTEDPVPFDSEEMKRAFQAIEKWKKESRRIDQLYDDFYKDEVVRHAKLLAKGVEAERINSR